jgi:hypothetical protein
LRARDDLLCFAAQLAFLGLPQQGQKPFAVEETGAGTTTAGFTLALPVTVGGVLTLNLGTWILPSAWLAALPTGRMLSMLQ